MPLRCADQTRARRSDARAAPPTPPSLTKPSAVINRYTILNRRNRARPPLRLPSAARLGPLARGEGQGPLPRCAVTRANIAPCYISERRTDSARWSAAAILPRPVHQGEEPAGCLSGGHNKAGCAVCSASSLTLADFHVEAARQQGRAGAVFNKKLEGAHALVLVRLESFGYACVVVVYERQRGLATLGCVAASHSRRLGCEAGWSPT